MIRTALAMVLAALMAGSLSAVQAPLRNGKTATGISYDVQGSGPPLVLITGSNLDRRMWAREAKWLAANHTVIRYDLRAHGQSDTATAPFSHLGDLWALLDELKVTKATLIGLSAGSSIALDAALDAPARVERIVLIGPAPSGYVSKERPAFLGDLVAALKAADYKKAADVLLATPVFAAPPESQALVRQMVTENDRLWTVSPALMKGPAQPAFDRLESVRVPTLVMIGENDTLQSEPAELLAKRIPGAQVVRVPNGGHLLNLTSPRAFDTAVSAFLSSAPKPIAQVQPFTIRVPDAVLADLKTRLTNARIPDPLQGDGWTHGTDIRYLRELVAYWRDRFDWRAQERRLNQLEQFTTTVDGLTIHFVHRRSKRADALPLLITHGWPGSFAEFTKIIGPLTDPAASGGRAEDAFHVVMPSIPGFAFSQAPREPGFDPARIARLEANLMAQLGYTRYGVQGGDWGSIISTQVALADAPHVAGLHLNMCFGAAAAGTDANAGLTDRERERLKLRQAFQAEETGYQQIQGTKPQTLGVALNDSPAGLAAWIIEKFRTWCDCDGNPETVFTKDELLTNITLYWVTQTPASSARIYYESRHAPPAQAARIEVPTACADFPKEIIWSPRRWLEARYNIVRWTEMPRGGHFAAMEQPQLLVEDVREFFRALR